MAQKPSRAAARRTHSRATTTPKIRRAIHASDEMNTVLAKRYGVNRKTIAKWKGRDSVSDGRMAENPRSTVLTDEDEAIILAYRWRTRLALNDCHERLRRLMPHLSRSALYRCLKRHGLSRIGLTRNARPLTNLALKGPFTFEITIDEVVLRDAVSESIRHVFLAIEEITKHLYAEFAAQRRKTRPCFSPIWSRNSPRGSCWSPPIFCQFSPIGPGCSARTWRFSAITRSRRFAAPTKITYHRTIPPLPSPRS